MNNYTTNYEFRQVNSKYIFSDMDYQRTLDLNRVRKIVANFDKNLVNPVKVSFRDGKYYVFDGQHTLAALKALNHNQDLPVYCKVYTGLTKKQEAQLFSQQNGISRSVKTSAKFKALYVAGDVEIAEMVKLAQTAGFIVDFSESKTPYRIVAVSKLYKIFKETSSSEFLDILNTINAAWNGLTESLSTEILGGMYLFCTKYRGQFNHDLLIKQLSKVAPAQIISYGKMYKDGGDIRYAVQILNAYNKNLSKKRLKDDLLR